MTLEGTTALITGGASGLGEATLRRFVRRGANAVVVDIDEVRARAVCDELGAAACFVKADVASESDVVAAVDHAVERFGGVQMLVNCGASAPGPPRRTVSKEGPHPLEDFEQYIRSYLVGTFNTIRLVAHEMSRNEPGDSGERGVVINTASVSAFEGQIGQAAYAAAKAGVVGMTLPIARDLAVVGVRVVTISPGFFATPRAEATPQAVRDSLIAQTPFPRRMGRPEEFAHMAQTIVENGMLNGEVVRLDGAMRLGPK